MDSHFYLELCDVFLKERGVPSPARGISNIFAEKFSAD